MANEVVRVQTDVLDPLIPATGRDMVIANLQALLDVIPEAPEGDEYVVVERILSARNIDELDSPWDANSLEHYLNKRLVFVGARRRQSDFQDGIGWYLILDIVEKETGEAATVTTGSVSIVTQIMMAARMVEFPFEATPVVSRKPTARGYYPQHLEQIRRA